MTEEIKTRLVQAPSGVPVGSLVAKGEVELGFQQLTELLPIKGINILGNLPPEIEYITTFSAGVPAHPSLMAGTAKAVAVHQFLNFLSSAQTEAAKRNQGMYFL
jgi:molybdate transport system substrate-binding protein